MVDRNSLKIPYSDPLRPEDSESQTYGCRANNPSICSSNGIDGICAFSSKDGICRKPSRAWKKKYLELKEGEKNG